MKYISILFLGLLICTSCSSDEDTDVLITQNEKYILGTWFFDKWERNTDGEVEYLEYYFKESLEFKDNGLVFTKRHFDDNLYPSYIILLDSQYHLKGDSLSFDYKDDSRNTVKIQKLTANELIYSEKNFNLKLQKEFITTTFLKR